MRLLIVTGTPKEALDRSQALLFFIQAKNAAAIIVIAAAEGHVGIVIVAITATRRDRNTRHL